LYEKRGIFQQSTLSTRWVRANKASRGFHAFVGFKTVSEWLDGAISFIMV